MTIIAGLNAALYRGPYIVDLDKLVKHDESDKPFDKDDTHDPVEQVIDLSGFPHGDPGAVRGYRRNKAGRRVNIDITGSGNKKRVSQANWPYINEGVEKDARIT